VLFIEAVTDALFMQVRSPQATALRMRIDGPSMANLELVQGPEGGMHCSLLEVLDHCASHGGKRMLRVWLCRPLCSVADIVARQRAVAALQEEPQLLAELHDAMRQHPDLPRRAPS
jgi:DNA mismatch repair protein MSH6